MTATEVKDALRRRHPALGVNGGPGQWTCIEEFLNIDLLALSAWSDAKRIGYEVKVSRSDLRRELLAPHKRVLSVEWCHEFYFAVPSGLLTDEEIAYVEPEWDGKDFVRTPCPSYLSDDEAGRKGRYETRCYGGKRDLMFVGPLPEGQRYREWVRVDCEDCGGRGYGERSRVEREAPTCWVPRDVGLIVVTKGGCRVVKRSPFRHRSTAYEARAADQRLTQLARHASFRPDPRHRERNGNQEVAHAAA